MDDGWIDSLLFNFWEWKSLGKLSKFYNRIRESWDTKGKWTCLLNLKYIILNKYKMWYILCNGSWWVIKLAEQWQNSEESTFSPLCVHSLPAHWLLALLTSVLKLLCGWDDDSSALCSIMSPAINLKTAEALARVKREGSSYLCFLPSNLLTYHSASSLFFFLSYFPPAPPTPHSCLNFLATKRKTSSYKTGSFKLQQEFYDCLGKAS